jgi:hypothetical protein
MNASRVSAGEIGPFSCVPPNKTDREVDLRYGAAGKRNV